MHLHVTGILTRFSRNALLLLAATLFIAACASVPEAPVSTLDEARSAIASAEQAGARQYAGAELDEAQQKLIRAEESVENEKMVDAERYAQQATTLATLATARTESAKATEINREMERSIDALIEEMRRQGDDQ